MIDTAQLHHEIAMLYLKSQDLSGKTASEVYEMYTSALTEIMNKSADGWD